MSTTGVDAAHTFTDVKKNQDQSWMPPRRLFLKHGLCLQQGGWLSALIRLSGERELKAKS
ncbi:MAG: hypothetical protein O2999_09285 [Nitrospirae bacterium]|nr:hypothetical protein [Nitrospirota bacterium]